MRYRVVLAWLVLVACGEQLPRHSLVTGNETVPETREACAFTEQKCTRCHTIGRVLAWDAHTRADWEPLVTRMRQMASSGITRADAEIVLHCLEQRDRQATNARR
jgi:hypothetical protein